MKAFWLALLTACIWGFAPFVEKIGLSSKNMDPLVGVVFRATGGFVAVMVLMVFLLKFNPQGFKNIDYKAVSFLVLGGLLGSVIGQIFFYQALKAGDVSLVAPIVGTFPLIAFVLGIVFLGEKITIAKAAGVMMIISGVVLLK